MGSSILIFSFIVSLVQTQWSPYDPCTNECEEGNPTHWCGKHRLDSSGQAYKCVQATRYGDTCVSTCGTREENYFWCWTNAHNAPEEYWEYCGLEGYTTKGVPCVGECSQEGEKYWWCSTDKEDLSVWDYCSPPGQVQKIDYTRYGHGCLGACAQHGSDYWWCSKSIRWTAKTEVDSDDDWWEYCSPDKNHTRYNVPCLDECASRGYSYFWCYTTDGTWDYCSPQANTTNNDQICNGICDRMSESYTFCETKFKTGLTDSWWDYCQSPHQPSLASTLIVSKKSILHHVSLIIGILFYNYHK